MTIEENMHVPPCADSPDVYLDEALRGTLSVNEATGAERQRLERQHEAAHRNCAGCPVLVDCLYRAVVEVDVFGYAACTTEADRQAIRRKLGIEVPQQTTGPFAAPRAGIGPIDHETVMSVRQSYPHDTCLQLAHRLGCSTSTVKRHLRRAREADAKHQDSAPTVPTVAVSSFCMALRKV